LGNGAKYDSSTTFRICAQIQNLGTAGEKCCLLLQTRSCFYRQPGKIISFAGNKA